MLKVFSEMVKDDLTQLDLVDSWVLKVEKHASALTMDLKEVEGCPPLLVEVQLHGRNLLPLVGHWIVNVHFYFLGVAMRTVIG
jgi:hypothetical protein